jgi:hypothetical protein
MEKLDSSFQIDSHPVFGRELPIVCPGCKITLFLFEKNNFSMLHLSA